MGNISMPKHNAEPDVMKAVLRVFFENGKEWLDNSVLIEKLKLDPAIGKGYERQSYTKRAQIPAYFRFIEWEEPYNRRSSKRITESGERFYQALINKDKANMHEEILFSLENNNFGRNVHGTPSCDSNIEPPKLFIFFALKLGNLTSKEFAYILENIDDNSNNINDLLEIVKKHRIKNNDSITRIDSKYTDAKPIKAMKDWGFFDVKNIGRPQKIGINNHVLKQYSDRLNQLTTLNDLIDFVEKPSNDIDIPKETNNQAAESKKASITGDKAEKIFEKKVLKEYGWDVENVTDRVGKGYDFFCKDPELYIEIKGCRGSLDSIRLTINEWEVAKEKKDKYILIIVYNIEEKNNEKMKKIVDPFSRLDHVVDQQSRIVINYHIKGKYLRELN